MVVKLATVGLGRLVDIEGFEGAVIVDENGVLVVDCDRRGT